MEILAGVIMLAVVSRAPVTSTLERHGTTVLRNESSA